MVLAEIPRLGALLSSALDLNPGQLVVDLSGCPQLDASAIGLLLEVHRRACLAGSQLTLREPIPSVRRNLRLSRADWVLDVQPPAPSDDGPDQP